LRSGWTNRLLKSPQPEGKTENVKGKARASRRHHFSFFVLAFSVVACVVLVAAQRAGRTPRPAPANLPETNPQTSELDLTIGRKLYEGRCGHCHGQTGEGGRGAVLNTGRLRHGGTDRDLFLIVRNGIPNTEMPGTFSLPDKEVWRMVAHVRQLGRQGASDEPVPGDPAAGARVYQQNACAACHSIDGQGGFLGPDLSDIGVRRAVRHLRQSVVEPNADIPLDYRSVLVITRAGATVSGIHLNEDEYSVHLRDTDGNLRAFLKSELTEIQLPRESLMPAYGAVSPADLENLLAFLAKLSR
jgi:cytochrome c oxidase cbb3-type subunit 3